MDILLNDDDSPVIRNGDFEGEEDTNFQHVRHLFIAVQGEIREFPLSGIGLRQENKATGNTENLKRRSKLQLEIDGYRVDKLNIEDFETIDFEGERVN